MSDQPDDEVDLMAELMKHPPPPEGVIPEGTRFTEYHYVEDGQVIHGVAHGSRIHHRKEIDE